MILAIIGELRFRQNPNKHTITYAKACSELAFSSPERMNKVGTYKAVVAEDLNDAVGKLSEELRQIFRTCWFKPQVWDFTFKVAYSEVDDDGTVWLTPMTYSTEFAILPE